jgi:hypothetical protein
VHLPTHWTNTSPSGQRRQAGQKAPICFQKTDAVVKDHAPCGRRAMAGATSDGQGQPHIAVGQKIRCPRAQSLGSTAARPTASEHRRQYQAALSSQVEEATAPLREARLGASRRQFQGLILAFPGGGSTLR